MASSTGAKGPLKIRLSTRSPLIEIKQEVTLRATLENALGSISNCFDDGNREAEPGSVYSRQAEECKASYDEVDSHKTTLYFTEHFAKILIHGGLGYLRSALDATLDTGFVSLWPSQSLIRSLIEASADCLWLVDPKLDLETRLRRTNQAFVRYCDEMIHMMPDRKQVTSRFISVDSVAKAEVLKRRDSALKWAKAQGWTCANGKPINRGRWIGEIPRRKDMVALTAQGEPDYWKDVYSTLSAATHSQPLLMVLSIEDDPDSHLDRALMLLDIGISFYKDALQQLAEFMGWDDHEIEKWFAPVHLAIQHIRSPEDIPLPEFEYERCEVCPEYDDPEMHRLAFVSHLCALLDHNIDAGNASGAEAPERYSLAVELTERLRETLIDAEDSDPKIQEIGTALGFGHTNELSLSGSDVREVFLSIAASWAVLRSPSYQRGAGKLQR